MLLELRGVCEDEGEGGARIWRGGWSIGGAGP